ncbi:MAG TPA: hypothetical protein DCQ98_16370 [Planctomycetaceae bacterium]|nr:hypothetical protein [Planctomycetaceae bacterium]
MSVEAVPRPLAIETAESLLIAARLLPLAARSACLAPTRCADCSGEPTSDRSTRRTACERFS